MNRSNFTLHLIALLSAGLLSTARAEPLEILNLPQSGTDPEAIDFDALPKLAGEHAVINPVHRSPSFKPGDKLEMNRMRLNLHNYLAFHDGKFWCIWSDGPQIEDWPTQEIKYATSEDGKHFTRMAQLDVPASEAPAGFESIWKKFSKGIASLQYPHAIEKDGYLWIALSRCKLQTEIFRVALDDVDALRK